MLILQARGPVLEMTPSIHKVLRPVGLVESQHTRMLSSLCSLTYFMNKVTVEGLRRRYNLHLVTSSRACDLGIQIKQASPLQAIVEGDATAADVPHVLGNESSIVKAEVPAAPHPQIQNEKTSRPVSALMRQDVLSKLPETVSAEAIAIPMSSIDTEIGNGADRNSVNGDIVSSSLSVAAAAVYSAAGPLAGNITAFTSSAAAPIASVASTLQSAASAGHSTAAATIATVSAAVMSKESSKAGSLSSSSPTEWFVADDVSNRIRYFVIQGSDNLDHWRVNLTFDPVVFEDPALGAYVHRGVYETALVLYDRFLPLVEEHIASHPSARIAFTGHSLGGSLGTLLMMMYLHRRVIGPENVAPVYTFGAPAIFCEGGCGGCGGCCAPEGRGKKQESSNDSHNGKDGEGILQKLGLSSGAVRNVMMHKDIVPRAFACDYSLVADILKRVGDSFRDHMCLSGTRKIMFHVVGKVMVLQPDAALTFVGNDGYHPLLPNSPGLYVLREANGFEKLKHDLKWNSQQQNAKVEFDNDRDYVTNTAVATKAAVNGTNELPRKDNNKPVMNGAPVTTINEAIWLLMNTPHPLDILADRGAYGDRGSISRYHNPDNYTRALGAALHARGDRAKEVLQRTRQSGLQRFAPPFVGISNVARLPHAYSNSEGDGDGGKEGGKYISPVVSWQRKRQWHKKPDSA